MVESKRLNHILPVVICRRAATCTLSTFPLSLMIDGKVRSQIERELSYPIADEFLRVAIPFL